METRKLITQWFNCWEAGNIDDLPITQSFTHHSPFGTIKGKAEYMKLINANREKFLGQTFTIHDSIYSEDKACVRYTARQGEDFSLDVSEWYYVKDGLIDQIHAYYHIGEIREDRKLNQ